MDYQIREMVIQDIEIIIAGEEKVFGESLGYDMLYSELVMNPFAYYFVMEINNEVHGYIGVWIDEDHSEIINFYIDEEYQSMGFGSMMLEFVIELCGMSNVPNISLEVRESNIKAQKIYEKYGFKYSHKRERYYKNGENAFVLIKELKC